MCTQQELSRIMAELIQAAHEIFGPAVKEIILYGSYARGEGEDESDIDVMLLLDLPREQLPAYRRQLAQAAGDLLIAHGMVVSPVLESWDFFDRNRLLYPFFRNIDREGIRYAA